MFIQPVFTSVTKPLSVFTAKLPFSCFSLFPQSWWKISFSSAPTDAAPTAFSRFMTQEPGNKGDSAKVFLSFKVCSCGLHLNVGGVSPSGVCRTHLPATCPGIKFV